jgi:tetratricopeptide (TPR) repeat protein
MAEAFERAAAEFGEAITLDPLLALAHCGRGQAFMGLKSYPPAIQAFIGCRDAYRALGAATQSDAAAAEKRIDDEIRSLRDGIHEAQSGRLKINTFETIRMEERIRDLERMKQRGAGAPDVPGVVYLSLGSAYFRSGQLADAEREYLEAVKASPTLGEAYNNLAVVYLMTGRQQQGKEAVSQAEKAGFRVNPQLKRDLGALPQ